MKTDDWIAMLATHATAADTRAIGQRHATAVACGAAGAVLIAIVVLGLRPDLASASRLPMFWIKLAFPLAVAAVALVVSMRLSRPGTTVGFVALAVGAPVLVLWSYAALVLAAAPPGARPALLMGQTWRICPLSIALVSVPACAMLFWALKGLAPTRPALSGGATGLLAGAIGAAAYALHCTEMEAPFLAIWYVLGMLVPAVAGAMLGQRLLRW
jgi:hypothetical protein